MMDRRLIWNHALALTARYGTGNANLRTSTSHNTQLYLHAPDVMYLCAHSLVDIIHSHSYIYAELPSDITVTPYCETHQITQLWYGHTMPMWNMTYHRFIHWHSCQTGQQLSTRHRINEKWPHNLKKTDIYPDPKGSLDTKFTLRFNISTW